MFQCIYKNIGTEELRGANPVGKACRGIGKSRDNFIPGGIGRFGGLAQNEITSVAGDSGFVKQFAQKGVIDFSQSAAAAVQIAGKILFGAGEIVDKVVERSGVKTADSGFSLLMFPVLPPLQKATGKMPRCRNEYARWRLCAGAKGAPSPPFIRSSERKSKITGIPVKSASICPFPTCNV